MASNAPVVCLITPGHVASTPRLVKNADALAEAGYRVHVVSGRHFAPADALDDTLLARAKWSHTCVDFRSGWMAGMRKLLRYGARRALRFPSIASLRLAARAHHAETFHLARSAAVVPAQLYLGHCLAGLPAAAFAAAARGVGCGFDAEDFHDAEGGMDETERIARRTLQTGLLSRARILTAASPLIAESYRETYGVRADPLLNVFPLSEAPTQPVEPTSTANRAARLYWFSQTIGPGRGLEQVIAITARMRMPTELYFRGFVSSNYASHLRALAGPGRAGSLHFLAPAPPAEMVRLSADADLGLSTEEPQPLNRDLCLTNKIFVYLLAGLPQLLSHTRAQAALAPELGSAALLARLEDPLGTALQLDAFFSAPSRVAEARQTAWQLARQRFCWDIEKLRLLQRVAAVLPLG